MFYVNARAIIERDTHGTSEIIVQTRNKKNELALELPGGRLELYEPILTGLKREVYEETGLTVIEVEGSEKRIDTCGINPDFEVECLQPYCVYQTINGPVDSIGMYFICKVEGQPVTRGDETLHIRWESIEQVYERMMEDPRQFSDVDRAGIKYYLTHKFAKNLAKH